MRRLGELAERIGAQLAGDPMFEITGLCGLSDDLPLALSFLGKPSQRRAALASRIPAFITRPEHALEGKHCLLHPDPDLAIVELARLFEPSHLTYAEPHIIHPSAVVHPTAVIGEGSSVGAHVVVGEQVRVGARCVIHPGVVIMNRVAIGDDCVIHPNAVVREDSVLGHRVVLQPGAVVGGDGYGFLERDGRHIKIPQLGHVVLEDDVEIGANTTIDRGRFTATRVGRGTKVDNLVMIAHNVQVGEQCLIVAQTGISGSTHLGDRVTLAGQVGVTGHLEICSDVTVMGKSVVAKHVLRPGVYAGIPIRPIAQWKKTVAKLNALAREPGDTESSPD